MLIWNKTKPLKIEKEKKVHPLKEIIGIIFGAGISFGIGGIKAFIAELSTGVRETRK